MIATPAETLDNVVLWRRAIHRKPELGFEEHETSALVERVLRDAGLETRRIAGTGLVGILRGAHEGGTLALRADMDGLPLEERSGVGFASETAGAMHACGHDAHTAMLLGAAASLAAERRSLSGTIKFFFQPAEEGPGGAQPMIQAGVMDSPRVDMVAAIHVTPMLPTGSIGLRTGAMTASCDDFELRIKGRGGHAGYPHSGVDTIPIAAEIVGALQRLVSRESDPLRAAVLSIGRIEGGYRRNIIADLTTMSGTVRCLDDAARQTMHDGIERVAAGITSAHRATHELDYEWGYPAVLNDARATARVREIASGLKEVSNVLELERPTMGAEDFAYFAQAAPGCFMRLGCAAHDDADPAWLHSPEFRLDEACLKTGVAVFRALAHALPRELPFRREI